MKKIYIKGGARRGVDDKNYVKILNPQNKHISKHEQLKVKVKTEKIKPERK